jgi:hypothetical protein
MCSESQLLYRTGNNSTHTIVHINWKEIVHRNYSCQGNLPRVNNVYLSWNQAGLAEVQTREPNSQATLEDQVVAHPAQIHAAYQYHMPQIH